jgi:hypothetical protein
MERGGNGKTKGKPVMFFPLHTGKEGVIQKARFSADRPHTFSENRPLLFQRNSAGEENFRLETAL